MKMMRKNELIQLTRMQVISAIESDLEGRGESLMKEVFERCESSEDLAVVYEEMRRIAEQIRTGRSYSECRQRSISIDGELHSRLRAHSAATCVPMAQIVESLLADLPEVAK